VAPLSGSERQLLLRLARASIEDAVLGRSDVARAIASIELTAGVLERRGVFVTLRDRRAFDSPGLPRLRGCIGTLEGSEPLYRGVIEHAAHAALRDPRFPAVRHDEIPHLDLEISALTPTAPVEGPEAITAGSDGVELRKGAQRAVFLPQVAGEQGWSTTELLEHLARKAGLPADGWRGAVLLTFRAEVFGDSVPGGEPGSGSAPLPD
jgi:AmmeMemoRadiSam system protein A